MGKKLSEDYVKPQTGMKMMRRKEGMRTGKEEMELNSFSDMTYLYVILKGPNHKTQRAGKQTKSIEYNLRKISIAFLYTNNKYA